jgi:flagellar basal-body rod modification protein FlgD
MGLDRIFLTNETVGIPDETAPGATRLTFLQPARPNPASLSTVIGAKLGAPAHVQLKIASAAGRVVRELYAGHLGAGLHGFPWDGRDDRGTAVAAGVYFIQLRAGEHTEVGRLAVVR